MGKDTRGPGTGSSVGVDRPSRYKTEFELQQHTHNTQHSVEYTTHSQHCCVEYTTHSQHSVVLNTQHTHNTCTLLPAQNVLLCTYSTPSHKSKIQGLGSISQLAISLFLSLYRSTWIPRGRLRLGSIKVHVGIHCHMSHLGARWKPMAPEDYQIWQEVGPWLGSQIWMWSVQGSCHTSCGIHIFSFP